SFLLSFALWTPYALLYTVQQIIVLRAHGTLVSSPQLIGQQLAFFVPWAVATPFVLGLGRRFPLRADRWLAPLPAHLTAILVLTSVHCVVIVAAEAPANLSAARSSWMACMTRGMLLFDAFLYLVVSLAGVSLRLRQKDRDRERYVSRLQMQLAETRLRA